MQIRCHARYLAERFARRRDLYRLTLDRRRSVPFPAQGKTGKNLAFERGPLVLE
ncbi:hypothetical protein D3C81_1657950 [compost metagenome]